jgi:hypothetical protein
MTSFVIDFRTFFATLRCFLISWRSLLRRLISPIQAGDGKAYIRQGSPRSSEPFHLGGRIAFDWDPFNAARGYTCEEDLLTELIGRKQRPMRTEKRWTRVNLSLYANLPYGSTTPMPDIQILSGWTHAVHGRLGACISEVKESAGRVVAVTGGLNEVEVQTRCKPEGVLSLLGFSISSFRLVRIPRVWDDPQRREAEKDISGDLAELAHRFKDAYDEWKASIADLYMDPVFSSTNQLAASRAMVRG